MTSPANPSSARAARPSSIVGREREQALLREQLDQMLAGRGGLVLVSGEAGIGKTTLVENLVRQAGEAGALVLWGHAYDLSVTPPYGPWVELLGAYPQREGLPSLPAFVGDLEASTALGSQERLFAATRDFLAQVAARQPLLLVLEDIHWADGASLDFLRVLARQTTQHRILIAATYRSDELHRHHPLYAVLPLLVREVHATRVEVRPLNEAGQRALLQDHYALSPADQSRVEQYLGAHAEGNPLYAGELLRTLEEEGVLVQRGAGWQLGDLEHVRVPPLLRQVIEGRLSRLGDETRQLLQVAAVIGHEVPFELWRQVSGASDEVLVAAIERGQTFQLIEEVPGSSDYRFRHALFREALYEEVIAPRRRHWHRQVAEALAATASPDPDVVAQHFTRAGDPRAAEWLLRAGERAQRAYAWMTAADRFEEAVRVLEALGAEAGARGWLLVRVGWLRRMADSGRAVAALDEVQRLAALLEDHGLSAYATFSQGLFRCQGGNPRQGLTEMQAGVTALEGLTPTERERLRERLFEAALDTDDPHGVLAIWLADIGRYAEAQELVELVVAGAPAPSRSPRVGGSGYVDAYVALAYVHAALGRPSEARRAFARTDELLRALDDDFTLGHNAAYDLRSVVLPYQADQLAERDRLVRVTMDAWVWPYGANERDLRVAYASLLVLEGRWDEIRAIPFRARLAVAKIAREQGDAELAWSLVKNYLPAGPATEPGGPSFSGGVAFQRLAVTLALDAGDLSAAREWLEAHDRWLDWSGSVLGRAEGQLAWAAYYRAAGDLRLARQHADQALVHATNPRQPLALLAAHRLLGELATEDRCYPEAEQNLQHSLTLAEACAAPFERALTLLGLAELRAAQRKPDEARALLAEVRAICEPLEARPTLARIAAFEQRLVTTPHARPFGLSEREAEVLKLVAEGLTDAQIADKLFVSRRTVTSHLTGILNKLGVSSRAAAVAIAARHDLL